ncbi:ATPase, ParA family protein [Novosphingobium nitrogenifigens DSM 19370]|uniref:ATPase, ParA family protein n=1 Tax=Novosphingobium nitrogenifigens DSM 19370 TaxID=983920 RepID=F1Z7R1_9SPHN|nr:ParA family protein [Novosphingobium nitrogenifigens]EGD59359.1 ATPase, ParA family protein [Novosphingobium nitrogenifigens DSM 19370]
MAVIGVWSVKGGVGKTTLAVDLAWRSAMVSNHRTLLWDLDPQGGAGWLLGVTPASDDPDRTPVSSVFQRETRAQDAIVETRWPGLSVLPADDSLRHLPATLARIGKKRRLAKLTARLAADYPRVILDCPPVLNEISDQVIGAADLLIVPLPPSPLSARALDMIREELVRHHQGHPPILPVLSMLDTRRRLHREVHQGFAAGWPVVPMASVIEQMAARRTPVGAFAGATEASHRLQKLWDAIEAKLRMRAETQG